MISLELFLKIILILLSALILLFLFFVIRSITYDAKKLSDINKIIKEAKISEIQKIGDFLILV